MWLNTPLTVILSIRAIGFRVVGCTPRCKIISFSISWLIFLTRSPSSRKPIVVPGISSLLSSVTERSRMRRTPPHSWAFCAETTASQRQSGSCSFVVHVGLLGFMSLRRLNLKEFLCVICIIYGIKYSTNCWTIITMLQLSFYMFYIL